MKLIARADLGLLTALCADHLSGLVPGGPREERLAGFLGRAEYRLRPGKARNIAHAIAKTLNCDEYSDDNKETVREVLRSAWRSKFLLSDSSRSHSRSDFKIEGIENLIGALERGRGVVLWESPFGNRLLGKSILAREGYGLWQTHARTHWATLSFIGQKVVGRLHRHSVSGIYQGIIDMHRDSFGYLRKLTELLGRNEIVCISGFGGLGRNLIDVDFLGKSIGLPSGTLSLVRQSGASLVPMFCFRNDDKKYTLVLEQPIVIDTNLKRNDSFKLALRSYIDSLESFISKYPGQWYMWDSYPGSTSRPKQRQSRTSSKGHGKT